MLQASITTSFTTNISLTISPELHKTGAIVINNLREILRLRDNFSTEKQQNQTTIQILIIVVGSRSYSVYVYVNCFPIIEKTNIMGT